MINYNTAREPISGRGHDSCVQVVVYNCREYHFISVTSKSLKTTQKVWIRVVKRKSVRVGLDR